MNVFLAFSCFLIVFTFVIWIAAKANEAYEDSVREEAKHRNFSKRIRRWT